MSHPYIDGMQNLGTGYGHLVNKCKLKREEVRTEYWGFQILSSLEEEENLAKEIEVGGNLDVCSVPEAKRGKYLRRKTSSFTSNEGFI